MTEALLEVDGLEVCYGSARALQDISFELNPGSCTAILGANGAGKSTLAKALVGLVRPSSGRVLLGGRDVTRWPAHRIARIGVAHVPEGRGIFPGLSVQDNLRMGFRHGVRRSERRDAMQRVFERFPVLQERRRQQAVTLSGGQQQMLALARILAAPPRLLIADELSLGLAPMLVEAVFEQVAEAREAGVAVLLIEQFVERALELADDAIILRRGELAWSGPARAAHERAAALYLGATADDTRPSDDGPVHDSRAARDDVPPGEDA